MSIAARAAATSFYRSRLSPGAEWASLPTTARADLVLDQLAHPPLGSRRIPGGGHPVRVGASGSGADLLVLAWSEHELELERRAGARMLAALGIAPGTAIANTLPGALAAPGSLLFGDVVEEHGALDVPLGAIEGDAAAKQAWELIERVSPPILCLEAATAERFFAAAPAAARPWLRGLVWLGRGASARRAEVPAAVGFEGWQRTWLALPEAASFAAWSCSEGVLHADEGLRAEIAGDRLLVTPLEGETALLRYDTGLAARAAGPCGCGLGGFGFVL